MLYRVVLEEYSRWGVMEGYINDLYTPDSPLASRMALIARHLFFSEIKRIVLRRNA